MGRNRSVLALIAILILVVVNAGIVGAVADVDCYLVYNEPLSKTVYCNGCGPGSTPDYVVEKSRDWYWCEDDTWIGVPITYTSCDFLIECDHAK